MRTAYVPARRRATRFGLAGLAILGLDLGAARVWLESGGTTVEQGQRVANPGLEAADGEAAAGFHGWDSGYVVDPTVVRRGAHSARCTAADPKREYGVGQTVVLNQTRATAILARVWSRAEMVSGAPDSNYSLYLDLEYMDGTPLWGQVAALTPGTHDWEQARVLVLPAKPVKSVHVLGLLRHHTGTAWFDDFELYELEGVGQFDMAPAAGDLPAAGQTAWQALDAGAGLTLQLDPATGAMSLDPQRLGGLVLRDAATAGPFLQPTLTVTQAAGAWVLAGTEPELRLRLEARLQPADGVVRVDATVRDLSGSDRAITVYWALPLAADDWTWCQDPQRAVAAAAPGLYGSFRNVGAGANEQASWYPFAVVTGRERGLALGAPITCPRLCRFALDATRRVLYAAFDLGLSAATTKSPGQATVSALLYAFPPAWRFRAALERYYELNADAFRCRARKQGIWMPFADIAGVRGWEDFGFQFQEGAPNPQFDEAHGIGSYPYIEPMSYWMTMDPAVPRETPAGLAVLEQAAARGERRAAATRSSGFWSANGSLVMSFEQAPWCNGALFLLNPDPDLPPRPEAPVTQYQVHESTIRGVLDNSFSVSTWNRYGGGAEVVPGAGRGGSRGAKATRGPQSEPMGLSQTVVLNQDRAREIVAAAWSRAEAVTGEPGGSYCLYLDLTYVDGDHLWGQSVPFASGTHDWEQVTVQVTPAKPVHSVALHVLLRGACSGTAWFDDISLHQAGDERDGVSDGSFDQPQSQVVIDGLYLDSFEMAATCLNYRRPHFASADLPLVFDRRGRVCQLGHFLALEFTHHVADLVHAQGKLMFANAVLHRFPWPAADLDVFGTETDWNPGGHWRPDSDEQMLYWRALCYKRPYLTLQNTSFEAFPPALVERYFARCSLYAVLPSFFSPDAASGIYWTRPELYDRDRPLFRRYIPVITRLAEAGWEPIPCAATSNAAIRVERYGTGVESFVVACNLGEDLQRGEVTVELGRGADGSGSVKAEELLPSPRDLGPVAIPYRWLVELGPECVSVLRLEVAR